MLLYILALVVAVLVALVVAAFLFARSKLAPPADSEKIYFPDRSPGLLGFFNQHLSLAFKLPAFQFYLDCATEARRRGKKAFFIGLTFMGRRVFPIEMRDQQYILVGNASNYVKGPDPYEKFEFILGRHNLVTIRDEALHTVHRKILAPCFAPKILAYIADTVISKNVEECMANVENEFVKEGSEGKKNGSDKLDHFFSEEALGIISEAAFRQRTVDGVDVGHEFDKLQNLGAGNFMYVLIPLFLRELGVRFVPKFKKVYASAQSSLGKLRAATAEMVRQAKARDVDDQKSVVDILAHETTFTEEEVASHAITTISAGHETTSKGLSFTAYLLAWNPKIQEILYDELSEVVHRTAVPNLDDIKDLPYLNAVIKESLRLLPPVPAVARVALKADVLPSGLRVNAGECVVVSPMICHHDPTVYGADVEEFKPDRWLDGKDEELRARGGICHYMPFLVGKRNCIGQNFAQNELLLTIATLVRRYRLEKGEGETFPSRSYAITMRPYPPKKMKLIPRDQ